jgi:hypothetical protein
VSDIVHLSLSKLYENIKTSDWDRTLYSA